jgi:hypothetical protein
MVACVSAQPKFTEVVPYPASTHKIHRLYVVVDNELILSHYRAHYLADHRGTPGPGTRLQGIFTELLVAAMADQLRAAGLEARVTALPPDIDTEREFSPEAILSMRLTRLPRWDDTQIYDAEYDVALYDTTSRSVVWRTGVKTWMNSQRKKFRKDAMSRFAAAVVEALTRVGAI